MRLVAPTWSFGPNGDGATRALQSAAAAGADGGSSASYSLGNSASLRASTRAAARASRPTCRIVAASGALTGAFMALIRLAFAVFVTWPARSGEASSEAARHSRYAQQSTAFVSPSPNFRNLQEIRRVAAWSTHLERGPMPFSQRHRLSRLPKRFPVGTTFVVEGSAIAADGKNNENLRVFSRFVVLPGGRRIDLGGDVTALTRSRRPRSSPCSRHLRSRHPRSRHLRAPSLPTAREARRGCANRSRGATRESQRRIRR